MTPRRKAIAVRVASVAWPLAIIAFVELFIEPKTLDALLWALAVALVGEAVFIYLIRVKRC